VHDTADPRRDADADAEAIRAELSRLQELVGPSEASYLQLRLDLMAARDHAIGTEAELGELRWRLEQEERSATAHAEALVAQHAAHVAHLQAQLDDAKLRLSQLTASRTWRTGRVVLAPWFAARQLIHRGAPAEPGQAT
jgi:hypothetical protein